MLLLLFFYANEEMHVDISRLTLTVQDEPINSNQRVLTLSEIQHKVKEYNALTNSNLYMVLVSPFNSL